MFIVEGTDLVGKTTVCEALVERLERHGPWVYKWFNKLPDCWNYYWGYLPHIIRHVVQDRFHMSEIVYRRMRDEPTELPAETYRMIDAHLRLIGSVTLVVTMEEGLLREQLKTRHEMHTGDQIVRANNFFLAIMRGEGLLCGYTIDFDFWHHVDSANNFPSSNEQLMQNMVACYLQRQEHYRGFIHSKPVEL